MAGLMARIESVTALHGGDGPPATLRLSGDVGPVLESTCVWAPGQAGTAGAIRPVDVSAQGLPFGLGAGAFGSPPERAVQRIGEFVLIEGASWWTPAAAPTVSRSEPRGMPVLTPFLFQWDHMTSAVAELRSADPVPLAHWYEYLLRRLAELGACGSGTIVVEIIADLPARLINDKHLVRAPLREFRPPDEQLITDGAHLDEYFLRNAAARASGDDTWCTAIMVGVAVQPAAAAAAWGPGFVQRGFYAMPGLASSSPVMHHTHALVTTQLPGPQPLQNRLGGLAERVAAVTDEWAAGERAVQVIHVESDTLLHRADVRIGVVGAITSD
jgi:hypothetical protein